MVVGKGGSLLSGARTVKAKAVTVRASGRRCLVGASTPLAALAALGKKPPYSIKDFGRCSRGNAADAAQLFVSSIGGEANDGADGWVYKLRDKIPSLGAGDRLAKLRTQDRLLWFYCVHDAAGHCPPTLRVEVPPTRAAVEPGDGQGLEGRRRRAHQPGGGCHGQLRRPGAGHRRRRIGDRDRPGRRRREDLGNARRRDPVLPGDTHGRQRGLLVLRRLARLLALTALLAGCTVGSGASQSGDVSLTVTRDFGAKQLEHVTDKTDSRRRDRDALPAAQCRRRRHGLRRQVRQRDRRRQGHRLERLVLLRQRDRGRCRRGRVRAVAGRPRLVGLPPLGSGDADPRGRRLLSRAVHPRRARQALPGAGRLCRRCR